MTKNQMDLVKIVLRKKMKFADLIKYVYAFKKYDNMTYRELDQVFREVKTRKS